MKTFTSPQQFIRKLQQRFLDNFNGVNDEARFKEAFECYAENVWGPRFDLPMLCHMGKTQPLENCLRFRIWYKPVKGGQVGSSECVETRTIEEAYGERQKLLAKGFRVEERPLGVVWDNAAGCFCEVPVKGHEK